MVGPTIIIAVLFINIKCLQNFVQKNKKNYEYFNVGTGEGVSVMQLVKAFIKVTGADLKYKIVGRREGDIEKIWADTSYGNAELGWKAEETIEDTILSAWNWEKRLRGI